LYQGLLAIFRSMLGSLRDLAPIIIVIGFFQFVVLQQPIPNLADLIIGVVCVLLGLTFFIFGLEMALFPIGESMAPALIAVAAEAATVAAEGGMIELTEVAKDSYATGLRFTVAFSVGLAIVLGVMRIIAGWSIQWMIIGGYILVVIMTGFAPKEIIGIAYDSGGVTTSTITVPLVTALGVGLASSIKGRNPMTDGFGLIAFASLLPMIFVMGYGMII
jgi:hypothetical protein